MDQRTIYSDNGTLTDYTNSVDDYHSSESTVAFVAAEDYLFIGAYLPFNHIYIKIGSTVNALASIMSVEYWDGQEFQDVAELVDETISSGATLAQSGYITFVPHKKWGWVSTDTVDVEDNEEITGLGDVKIYNKYWIRIKVSANLTANTAIKWIGKLFLKDDNDLEGVYPDLALSTLKTGFESGKTDWEEQRVEASKQIIEDLKISNHIHSSGQILEISDFRRACMHKVASIVYNAFGSSREEERLKASGKYRNSLNGFTAVLDKNRNARNDHNERTDKGSYGYR